MLQHLSGIAKPFAVLDIIRLACLNFAGGNQVLQFLYTSDNLCREIFAEIFIRHNGKNILKQYLFGVD